MKKSFSPTTEFAVSSFHDLICLAHAIETEAVKRYECLKNEMEKRNSKDTAQTFQSLMEQEIQHIEEVQSWAKQHQLDLPNQDGFSWKLPPEFSDSWDEVAHSTLLTPYKALAIAVKNEERTFAFYAYISAHAQSREVADAAEKMAHEELEHAMELRKHRRREFHLMTKNHPATRHTLPAHLDDFTKQVHEAQQQQKAIYHAIAHQLLALNDTSSADLLTTLASEFAPTSTPEGEGRTADTQAGQTSRDLLRQAQAPIESFIEFCDFVTEKTPSEDILLQAQSVLEQAITHLSRLTFQNERLD